MSYVNIKADFDTLELFKRTSDYILENGFEGYDFASSPYSYDMVYKYLEIEGYYKYLKKDGFDNISISTLLSHIRNMYNYYYESNQDKNLLDIIKIYYHAIPFVVKKYFSPLHIENNILTGIKVKI